MNIFEIKSVDGDGKLIFKGAIPRDLAGYDGCQFEVALSSTRLSATVLVYEIQPQLWASFFADLASQWRGWKEKKEKESLEHHLRITATIDSLGHVSLRVFLRDPFCGSDWRVEDTIHVEAGQLESIAAKAKKYFGL